MKATGTYITTSTAGESYRHMDNLEHSCADAKAVAGVLADVGFDSDHVFLRTDEQATRQNIQDLLCADMARKTGPNDRLLVFFAGHGQDYTTPAGRKLGYFVPVDGDPEYITSRCISMSDVETWSDSTRPWAWSCCSAWPACC